jgi:hypothetical protein
MRAARSPTSNVPKPTKDTEPPFFNVVCTASVIDSNARAAAAFDKSACLAMCSTNSFLFTHAPHTPAKKHLQDNFNLLLNAPRKTATNQVHTQQQKTGWRF